LRDPSAGEVYRAAAEVNMFGVARIMSLGCGWIALAAAVCQAAVTIDKVLPFTRAVDGVRIVTTVSSDAPGDITLDGIISSVADKKKVWEGKLGATAKAQATVEKSLEKLKVQPWSPGSPKLYELKITATQKGSPAVTKTVRFGFRSVESHNGQVFLNGKPIFLRGLAINPPGRTVPKAVGESRQFAYDYVKYLRGQNLNLIRLNESNQDWFDVCDELGMMVYQGFYGSPPTGLSKAEEEAQKKLETQDEAENKRLPRDFARSMGAYQKEFETYVHHPSIIIYILSNELPYKGATGEEVHKFLTSAYNDLSKWDHTRLFIGNAGYGEGHEGDINDVHRYWGWYYNTFATYYNLRDPKLFGDYEKNQPFTFSECVGNFTGPNGAYNCIERKQLAAALTWSGTALDQPKEAQSYQAFMTKQATELFRRMRPINSRLSGLMPFTIMFHNWLGITSFDQMKPTAAARQFGISYQPILLSWELWQTQVNAGAKISPIAHVVNDSDDFKDLTGAMLNWELRGANGKAALTGKKPLPAIAYYRTWENPIAIALPGDLATGEYKLVGRIEKAGHAVSTNEQEIFIAGKEWQKPPAQPKRNIVIYDDASGSTAKAIKSLKLETKTIDDLSKLNAGRDCLVIGERAWNQKLDDAKNQLSDFIKAGGRVICLGQSHEHFDYSWLPAAIEMCKTSVNSPEYMTAKRPMADGMHVNPQWPDHPVLAGVDRDRLKMWSDPTDWNETKKGFPSIYPVQYGFELQKQEDLGHVAIIADYDQGLTGVAVAEMFDGNGSVVLTGLAIVKRVDVDPVARRMLGNLITYMAGEEAHPRSPLVKTAIKWGDYATHQGLLSGPVQGFFINTDWIPPAIAPDAKPLTDAQGGWNTKPSDQFVPAGIRPRGKYLYTFNCSPRDADKEAKTGSGVFHATIPLGRKSMMTKVKNATTQPSTLQVDLNDTKGKPSDVLPGESITVETPISDKTTEIEVRYTGGKELIIEETSFQ
jgi:hypothetical protein